MNKNKINLNDICRICANTIKEKKRQRHIFNYLKGKLLQNLMLITGVDLMDNDNLPTFICDRCYSELDLAIKFRERCIFSQHYLQEMVEKKDNIGTGSAAESRTSANRKRLKEVVDVESEEDYDENHKEQQNSVSNSSTMNPKKPCWAMLEANREKQKRNFFICEDCSKYFNTEDEYKSHLEGHAEQKQSIIFFPCHQCKAFFPTKSMLRLHQRKEHDGNRTFECSTCGQVFLERSTKQRHELAHLNERPYPCLECNANFKSIAELNFHSIAHTKIKFESQKYNNKTMEDDSELDYDDLEEIEEISDEELDDNEPID